MARTHVFILFLYIQGPTKVVDSFSTLPEMNFMSFLACLSVLSFRFYYQFNGTPTKPRLSVFCSDKQLYAMLVDDQNKRCLFSSSTLQKSIRDDPPCTTIVSTPQVLERFGIFLLVERNLGFR